MKVVAIAQARMGSTRAPGKVMRDLVGIPVLQWTINALTASQGIDQIVLATSTLGADDVIANYCKDNDIDCFRGSEDDVLDRFYQCAKKYGADIILRLTCDCPFLDPSVISEVVKLREITGAHYASNIDPPTYPDGLDVECFTFEALEAAWGEATRPTDRDCVPQYIARNRHRFKAANLTCPLPGLGKERWVLDTEDDFKFCQELAQRIMVRLVYPSYLDILRILDKEPALRAINSGGVRNERFYDGLATEQLPPRSFATSQRLFARSSSRIPFGAQTFSKSHLQFPPGRAPLYVSHGDGSRIFDVDGNDYIDLVNAILPVILGYRDPDVDEAIRRQLDSGISFSLATALEDELAELLCRHIPCAEMVKFGKSGTDVTTAAIRLARAYTDRTAVIHTGYHGWADWSMATTDRNLGIPMATRWSSHSLRYGDYDGFTKHLTANVAAVIVEPNDNPDFLRWLRERCDQVGAVLIFDEVITGFRWAMGGAQALYNVTPDLATFGKAMGNGMPISALVGKRHIMTMMQPPGNIFYSGTMFGETLSLAAAIATIKKLEATNAIDSLWRWGGILRNRTQALIDRHGLKEVITLGGVSPRVTLSFSDNQIKTLFMQEMLQGGVLIINSHNMSTAIRGPEITRIMTAYNATLGAIARAVAAGDIAKCIGEEVANVAPLRAAQ